MVNLGTDFWEGPQVYMTMKEWWGNSGRENLRMLKWIQADVGAGSKVTVRQMWW